MNGTEYTEEDNLRIYAEALAEFKQEHRDFIGSKVIYAPSKNRINATAKVFAIAERLHHKFPGFLVGFDLVGQEDRAPMLVKFAKHILQLPKDMKFFFHAGETNWFGYIDQNMVNVHIERP